MPKNTKVMILPSPPSSGSIGSVTKCIGIARILEKRGCDVCFVMGDKLGKFIFQSGFKVYPYPTPIPNGNITVINSTVDFVDWTGIADEDFVQASIIAELDAIKDFKPDVIFAEARPSAAISAQISGVPSVMIASWPCNPEHPANKSESGRLVKVFNKLLKNYKLQEIENIIELFYMYADVKIAPTLPELEPEMQHIDGINFVGYILDLDFNQFQLPSWYEERGELPQIFIYLSVGALSPNLYIDTITETFRDLPFKVICGCGFHYNLKALPENLPNIKFESYIPTAAVMKDTDLVIFHGGQDTMLTTILYGLPSITIPGQHFERDYNATKLADTGASKKMPLHAFRPNRLRSVVGEVMSGPYAAKCKELSEKLKGFGGTEQCVDILINTARK